MNETISTEARAALANPNTPQGIISDALREDGREETGFRALYALFAVVDSRDYYGSEHHLIAVFVTEEGANAEAARLKKWCESNHLHDAGFRAFFASYHGKPWGKATNYEVNTARDAFAKLRVSQRNNWTGFPGYPLVEFMEAIEEFAVERVQFSAL